MTKFEQKLISGLKNPKFADGYFEAQQEIKEFKKSQDVTLSSGDHLNLEKPRPLHRKINIFIRVLTY